jgi:hypothetical protein
MQRYSKVFSDLAFVSQLIIRLWVWLRRGHYRDHGSTDRNHSNRNDQDHRSDFLFFEILNAQTLPAFGE